ncbi:MAG: 3-isopropylmalate dehydrogenase, partial [Candidatus Omnitrophica bacterium]|nr:3-isopropylmalate dehydrogenase [Candidatus Omnitrophota bacterium]
INPQGVSMFEPIGGSAPKYTGQGKINPLAAISALAMLLNQIGEAKAAKAVDNSVIKVVRERLNSLGAGRMGYSTSEVGDLVAKNIIDN